jgi:hypothetical protein
MKKFIIDRFEGNYALCEDEVKASTKIPKYKLPLECREGDALILNSDGMYHIDKSETKANESRIREKMNRLFVK